MGKLVVHLLVRAAIGRQRLAVNGDDARLPHVPDRVKEVQSAHQLLFAQFRVLVVHLFQFVGEVVIARLHQLERFRQGHGLPTVVPVLVSLSLQGPEGIHLHLCQVDVELGGRLELSLVVQVEYTRLLLGGEGQRGVAVGRVVVVVQEAGDARRHVGHALVRVVVNGVQVYSNQGGGDSPRLHDVGIGVVEAQLDLFQVWFLVVQEGGAEAKEQVENVAVIVWIIRCAQDGALELLAFDDLQTGDAEGLAHVDVEGGGLGHSPVVGILVYLRLHHPDQLRFLPADVVQFAGGVGHFGVKGHHLPPVADWHQGGVEVIAAVVVFECRYAIVPGQVPIRGLVCPDFEHGPQAQVFGRVVPVLHLPQFVVGPVQGGGGVAQVIQVLGLQLDFDVLMTVKTAPLGGQRKSVGVISAGKGREVEAVRHAIVVVVCVPQVRHAVAIGVPGVHSLHVGGIPHRGGPLDEIGQPVVVGVGFEGVAGPMLAAEVEPLDFQGVSDQVAVAVHVEGVGAQAVLGDVLQAVVVGVFAGGAVTALGLGIGGWRLEIGGWVLGIGYWVLVFFGGCGIQAQGFGDGLGGLGGLGQARLETDDSIYLEQWRDDHDDADADRDEPVHPAAATGGDEGG